MTIMADEENDRLSDTAEHNIVIDIESDNQMQTDESTVAGDPIAVNLLSPNPNPNRSGQLQKQTTESVLESAWEETPDNNTSPQNQNALNEAWDGNHDLRLNEGTLSFTNLKLSALLQAIYIPYVSRYGRNHGLCQYFQTINGFADLF